MAGDAGSSLIRKKLAEVRKGLSFHRGGSAEPLQGFKRWSGSITECPNWARSKESSGKVLTLHKEARAGRGEATGPVSLKWSGPKPPDA